MDNDIVSRIKILMDEMSLNSLSLSKILGYNSSEKISRLFRSSDIKAKPSYDIIFNIAKMFEINMNWLITGEGPMLRADESLCLEPTTPTSTPVGGATSDTVTMRLMDKLDEKDTIIKEKEEKIEQLQTELRKQGEELAALKSMQPRHVSPYERYEKSKEEGHSKGMIR